MRGRRERLRVPQVGGILRVRLQAPGLTLIDGKVLDLSSKGAGVEFFGPDLPGFEVGSQVDVVFVAPTLFKPIQVRAWVRRWVVGPRSVTCGLEFVGRDPVEGQIPEDMREAFNRRGQARVRLDEHARVAVESPDGGRRIIGSVVDISEGGMKVSVGALEAVLMESWSRVQVTFTLPGRMEETCFCGRVRTKQGTSLGIEFEPELTADYEQQRAMVEEFVAERLPREGPQHSS